MKIFPVTMFLLLLTLLFLCERSLPDTRQQTAVARWDSVCITKVEKTEDTYAEAPLDSDGQPDMKHVKAHGIVITFAHGCMQYKVQR